MPIRSTTIQAELRRIVLATALPVWVASALLLYQVQTDGWSLIERDAGATARAVMVAIDRDLASAQAAAMALAASPYLLSDDLSVFYAQANAILQWSNGSNVVLSDASGQQVLNTLRPYGEPLPRHGDSDLLQRVVASGKSAISDLYIGGVLHQPVVSIDVPVLRNAKVAFVVSIGFFPDRLADMLRQERLPPGWVASIFDSKGTIVARTHAADQYVGQKGAPALIREMAEEPEGLVETKTLEGIAVSALYSRSRISNWAVAIGVPTNELSERVWRSITWSIASTLALVAFSLGAAHFTGKRLVETIRSLATLALARGRGEQVVPGPLGLKEADDVAQAFAEGSRLLEERTVERDRVEGQRQQAQIEKQLAQESVRTRSVFFAYLSHELRAPLMAVSGCSDLIATRIGATSNDKQCLEYCARIDRGVRHISSVIDEILDYAKYEANEIELHLEPVDVAAEVQSTVELLEGQAQQVTVALRHEAQPNLPRICADPVRIRQILFNLLSNAMKFTPAGGTVAVSVTRADDAMILIEVSDTGIGISSEDLPRIMQPFAQVLNRQAKARKGTGLGLPLTKGLVELHGGSLTITSSPGTGTTVLVRLPIFPTARNASVGSGGT